MSAFLLALACARGGDPAPEPSMTDPVAAQLARVRTPSGDGAALREAETASRWLLDHADVSFPAVLAAVEQNPHDAAMVALLGRFGRAEATPALERSFLESDLSRAYAAAGLGASPDPAARRVLEGAVSSPTTKLASAALLGLGNVGNSTVCVVLRTRLADPVAELRWAALHSARRCGCVTAAELATITQTDPDADVRALAGGP